MRPASSIQVLSVLSPSPKAGTTTTAANLAAGLAEMGQQVLLVDLGDQAAASRSVGGDADIAAVLTGSVRLAEAIQPTAVPGLAVVPGTVAASDLHAHLAAQANPAAALHQALLPAREAYDVIVLDSPSAPTLLQLSAVAAADAFLVPVVPGPGTMMALAHVELMLRAVWRASGQTSPVLGYLLTDVGGSGAKAVPIIRELRARYGGKVLDTPIRSSSVFVEAMALGASVFEYDPDSVSADEYRRTAAEVLRRIGGHSAYYDAERKRTSDIGPGIQAAVEAYWAQFKGGDGAQQADTVEISSSGAPGPSAREALVAAPNLLLSPEEAEARAAALLELQHEMLADPVRLAALARTGFMDAPAQEAFDRATRVAKRLFDAPVATLSFLSDERQVYASALGLEQMGDVVCELPPSHTLCQYVVTTEEALLAPDTHNHPILQFNHSVVELGVRAYCGIPVREPGGAHIGALCVMDAVPRSWTEDDAAALADVAALVEAEIARLQNSRRFGVLLEAERSIVFADDGTGMGTAVGPAWEAYTGRSTATTSEWGWLDALHEDDRERVATLWQSCFESGTPYHQEIRILDSAGTPRRFQVDAEPVLNRSGRVLEYVGTYTDVEEEREATEALYRTDALMRSIFETSTLVMALVEIVDGTLCHVQANAAAARLYGVTLEALLARTVCPDGLDGAVGDAWLAAYGRSLESGQPATLEYDHPAPQGPRTLSATVNAVGLSSSETPLFTLVATDVTVDRARERAILDGEERCALALMAGRIGTWDVDLKTERAVLDERLHRLHGIEAFDGQLQTLIDMLHRDDLGPFLEVVNEAHTRATDEGTSARFSVEYRVCRGDDFRWFRAVGRIYLDDSGAPLRASGVALDITEERERAASAARLAEHTQEAQVAIEAAGQLQRNILHNMSHEIRTPLTAVLGCAEVLAGEVDGEQAELVDGIRSGGRRLLRTLDNVLELARLDGGVELDAQRVDLAEIVAEAVSDGQRAARRKGLRFSTNLPAAAVWVHTDPSEVRSAVAALVDNAVKFTQEGAILVEVRKERGGVRIEVTDDGCGMPQSFVERAFEPFEQGSTGLSRSYEGVGLGLALVRRIADLLGATHGVETEEGKGSMFWLLIPSGKAKKKA